jgi:hypothetical protein
MCETSLEFEATMVGVARILPILPFPLLSLRGDLVKLVPSSDKALRPRRRWRTATGALPSALVGNENPPATPTVTVVPHSVRNSAESTMVASASPANPPATSFAVAFSSPTHGPSGRWALRVSVGVGGIQSRAKQA